MQMKRETTVAIKVSENHRRSISITLQLIDQALCEWDDWTSGRLQSRSDHENSHSDPNGISSGVLEHIYDVCLVFAFTELERQEMVHRGVIELGNRTF